MDSREQMIQFYVEYLCATNSEESDIELAGECADQLRALLTAQPQAGAAIPFAGYDPRFCPGSNPDNPQTEEEEPEQASSAQSAPAGEREAVEVVGWRIGFPNGAGYKLYEQHQSWAYEECGPVSYEAQDLMTVAQHERILASCQRTQAAGVPDVSAMARVLSDRSADACNIDRADNWAMYGQEYIEDVQAMLAAVAPAQPAAQGEFGDAYQGAREDLAIWKRRALEAEARVRHQDQIIDQMGEDLNAINGPTFMGEPVIPAAQNQGEAQSRERWVVVCGHWQDTTLAIHGERTGHIASGIDEDAAHAIVNAHNQGLPPIVAASTGQEVKP